MKKTLLEQMLQMNGLQSDSGTDMLYLSFIGLPKFKIRDISQGKKSRFSVSLEKLEDLAIVDLHAQWQQLVGAK